MTDLIAELAEVVRLDSLCKSLPYNAKRADAYKDAAFEALGLIRTHHAEIEAMARDAMVSLGPELLRFSSFQDWVNHAQSRFANARVASSDYICVDATGRICRMGKHFMSARDRGAFPVIVYHIDPEHASAMHDSAREGGE